MTRILKQKSTQELLVMRSDIIQAYANVSLHLKIKLYNKKQVINAMLIKRGCRI